MALPFDPSRSTLPPVAQFLAEAALQRQSALAGLDKSHQPGAGPAPFMPADAAAVPPPATVPGAPARPVPAAADKASISAQAREQLAAGFDPRGSRGTATAAAIAQGSAQAPRGDGPSLLRAASSALRGGAQPPPSAGAAAAGATGSAAWPVSGLDAPVLRWVGALVAQATAQAGVPQRVVAAQPWPVGLAQALESGALDAGQPPLQTWLVRQGVVPTPDGPRGLAVTLRAPVPWLAGQAPPPAGAAAVAPQAGALQMPFAPAGRALQSGVLALVLQGMDAAAPRTSALLVLDVQPQLAATVYGREMLLQQATAGRMDPWMQLAVLQASGQVPRDDERARNGASGLCDTAGCPYAARAACVQPFCVALRPLATGPVAPA